MHNNLLRERALMHDMRVIFIENLAA